MPTESEIKSYIVALQLPAHIQFRVLRAISKCCEEAEERNRRDIEADKARVVDLIRGSMV